MAQFMAKIVGQKGRGASRLGSKKSGIRATVNAWDLGVIVQGRVDSNGQDCFNVYLTGGSNNREGFLVGIFTRSSLDTLMAQQQGRGRA